MLPLEFRSQVLEMLHDQQGHQVVECTLYPIWEWVYHNIYGLRCQPYGTRCKRSCTIKGPYVGPDVKKGSITANNPIDVLWIKFTQMNPSKNGKENVLVMMDAFSKFSVAVVTPDQHAKTVAKVLLSRWFHTYSIPERIQSDKGRSFNNDIIMQLC